MENEKNNMNSEEKLLFEYSNLHNMYDVSKAEEKKPLYKGARILMCLLVAAMICLLIYSAVVNVSWFGFSGLINVSNGVFAVLVVSVILILSITGKWNSFLTWGAKNKRFMGHHSKRQLTAFESNKAEKDALKEKGENALHIYQDRMIFRHLGDDRIFKFSIYKNIRILRSKCDFKIEVELFEGHYVTFLESIDNTKLSDVIFAIPTKPQIIGIEEPKKKVNINWGLLIFTAIPLVVGIILLAFLFSGYTKIPGIIGVIFTVGGLIAFLSVIMHGRESFHNILLPFLFGGVFFTIGFLFLVALFNSTGSQNFLHVFVYFPFSIAIIIFVLVGGLGVASAFFNLLKFVIREVIFIKEFIIEKEKKEDFLEIENLIASAFSGLETSDHTEHELVRRIRDSTYYVPNLSLVARTKNRIVGHIMLSEINEKNMLILAPLSVINDMQGKGVGGALVRAAHEKAKAMGYKTIVLIGHENYYPKFGYCEATDLGISLKVDVPSKNIMAISLSGSKEKENKFVELPKIFL